MHLAGCYLRRHFSVAPSAAMADPIASANLLSRFVSSAIIYLFHSVDPDFKCIGGDRRADSTAISA